MPASRMPERPIVQGTREVEAAGQDDGALSQRQDGEEARQHDERIPVAPMQHGAAEPELGDDDDRHKANVGGQGIAQCVCVPDPERRRAVALDLGGFREVISQPPIAAADLARQRAGAPSSQAPKYLFVTMVPSLPGISSISGPTRISVQD